MPMGSYVTVKAAFVALLILNALLWSQGSYSRIHRRHAPLPSNFRFSKRSSPGLLVSGQYDTYNEGPGECIPIAVPVQDQCELVYDTCPTSDTFLSIPYLQIYFCASPTARPFVIVGLLLWLDFFCPNLATIAQLLNLDENVAGVTLLAFGNGSPDVFATFAALRTNAGSLAIGELLGAASFIISCVVGSMCIIKPFRVNRGPFLRDTTFFAVSITTLLFILYDGWIYAWEAALLVVLYLTYVFTVIVGSWWERRREKRCLLEARIRSEYDDEGVQPYWDHEPYRDEPSRSPSSAPLLFPRTGQERLTLLPRLDLPSSHDSQSGPRSPSRSPRTMPSFSLVGALEFRSVISSLQQEAVGSALGSFEPLLTPYIGGHYHGIGHSRSRSHSGTSDASSDVPLSDRSSLPQASHLAPDQGPSLPESPLILINGDTEPRIPEISHTRAFLRPDNSSDIAHHEVATRRQTVRLALKRICHILFPTMHEFKTKSLLGKVAAVFAAPAVFALTITLPVVVGPYDSLGDRYEKAPSIINIFEEDGIERTLVSEDVVLREMHELRFNKWLMAVQCAFGPLFCTAVLFKGSAYKQWLLLGTGSAGLAAGILVALFAGKGDNRGWLLVRCSMGFLIAVVWIMAIADEVVNILQTSGFIFGLSDAIVGLTIFAAGNSIADLVANMSVAAFAPIMGFSACFGGPMLNILLGIGVSGSYVIHTTGEPYKLQFSNTLLVSTVGLLSLLITTMIFVPLNDYFLPRKWGVFLICFYVVIMTVNIIVEVLGLD
ncbi:Sodium/calcium exchanger protein-domain-containing protein [Russula aff. rugulosa BPL654]|nr:Sodium/calcium exchanger protein-domain-containing protein [Russula aff. rugulosa BPL654]